jgi:hypothetical protein
MAVQTITYDDKSYLNQNSDIADVNKVNDTDMNEIKTVVNNNANILISLCTYSTSEINTGKQWIDGKDIYQFTYYIPSLPNNTAVSYNLDIYNLNEVIYLYGKATGGLIINGARPDSSESSIGAWYDDIQNVLKCSTGIDRSSLSGYITILYTKTS